MKHFIKTIKKNLIKSKTRREKYHALIIDDCFIEEYQSVNKNKFIVELDLVRHYQQFIRISEPDFYVDFMNKNFFHNNTISIERMVDCIIKATNGHYQIVSFYYE